MRRVKSLIIILLSVVSLYAQNDSLFSRTTLNSWSISVGSRSVADSYLSNIEYSGVQVGLRAFHKGIYGENQHVVWSVYDRFYYGGLYNPAYTASMAYIGGHIGFDTHYRFFVVDGLTIQLGGAFDVYGGAKVLSRNVNNPVSLDFQTMLLASTAINYTHKWSKFGISGSYALTTPLLGSMFVPAMGLSLYEYQLDPSLIAKDIHLAAPHNRYGVSGMLALDLHFKPLTLRLSVEHENDWWRANNLSFYNHSYTGSIGVIVDIKSTGTLHSVNY